MSLTLPGLLYHVISLLVFCLFFELFCVISTKSQKTKPVQQILLLSSTSCRKTEFASYRTHPCKVHIYKSVVLGHSQNVWLSLLYNVRILLSSKNVPLPIDVIHCCGLNAKCLCEVLRVEHVLFSWWFCV